MPNPLALAVYAIVALHLFFVFHVLLGGLLLLKNPRLFPLHAPFFLYALIIEAFRFPCPLTQLEKNLRHLANLPNYTPGFLGYYFEPLIQAAGFPPFFYKNIGYFTVALNLLLYTHLLLRSRKHSAAHSGPLPAPPPPPSAP